MPKTKKRNAKKQKILVVVNMYKKDFYFRFKQAYDSVVDESKLLNLKMNILPTLKKETEKGNSLNIITMDGKTENLIKEKLEKFKIFSLKNITENLWDYDYTEKALDYVDWLSRLFEKNRIINKHEGIDLFDLARKDICFSYLYLILNFVDEAEKLVKRIKPDKIIIFDHNDFFEKIFLRIAEKHKIPVKDKTKPYSGIIEAGKKILIKKLSKYNMPYEIRTLKANEHPERQTSILICHNTITNKKVLYWAKLLAKRYDVVFSGNNQNSDEFIKNKIAFTKYADYATQKTLDILRKKRKELRSEYKKIRKIKNSIQYNGVNIHNALEELFIFLYNARFYEIICYIELFKEMFRQEKPKLLISVDDMSMFGRANIQLAHNQKIKNVLIQPGFFAKSPLFNKTIADYIFVYGNITKTFLAESGIKPEKIRIVGLPEDEIKIDKQKTKEEVYRHFRINKNKKMILLTSQGISESYNYPFLDSVYKAMGNFKDVQFIAKLHPCEKDTLHNLFIEKYGIKNIIIVKHGEYDLLKLLIACYGIINFYSTVGVEAISRGKYLLSVNVNRIPDFLLPKPKDNLITTSYSYEELVKNMNSILQTKTNNEKEIKELSKEYVLATGEVACLNVVDEIEKILKS